jgi:hypothetical protein
MRGFSLEKLETHLDHADIPDLQLLFSKLVYKLSVAESVDKITAL